jgi:methyl-accepting chemotaxis protein
MRKKPGAGDATGQTGSRAAAESIPAKPAAAAKSLMKTSELGARTRAPRGQAAPAAPAATPVRTLRRKAGAVENSADRQQKIEERVAAASEELASGITQASSAGEELRKAMELIASGAEEAASASQETPCRGDRHGRRARPGA